MWISYKNLSDLFAVAKDSVDSLRAENAALKAENAAYANELRDVKLNADWLRVQFNQLQLERTALLERVHGLRAPTPQLVPTTTPGPQFQDALFADLGDEVARSLGLPTYDN